jgi:hypothetical protein
MAPPHCGQSHCGRGTSGGVESATVCESGICPRRVKRQQRRPAPVSEEPEVPDGRDIYFAASESASRGLVVAPKWRFDRWM